MSRVLFLVNHDVVIYNFRLELVERLLADDHEVYISSPYGERIDDLVRIGCRYESVELSRHGMNPLNEIKLLRYYKELLRRVCPDIVFSYTIKPNVYGGIACQKQGIPYVANITGLGTAVENDGIVQKITVVLYKAAFRQVQKIYFQNTENMNFFEKRNIAIGKHALIPGSGVNLTRFPVLDYNHEDTVEFAFISRIMREKGIEQYLDAAEYIKSKYPNTRFHVCGFCEQSYEQRLGELEARGIITYHGMVRDVKKIMKWIHCVVHPTYYPEGLSNVLLEACASARPIITTDRSGCRETIDDRVNGFVVKQKDSVDLIVKIEKFLALSWDERREMGLAGRHKVEREFDRQIVVEAYMNELNRVKENGRI